MHRRMRDQLEEVLAGSKQAAEPQEHLDECAECRDEVAAMKEQAHLLHSLRAPSDLSPRPGFYARVMEQIESQGPISIWSLFFDSPYGQRIAIASVALALCMGFYMFSSEQTVDQAFELPADTSQTLVGTIPASMPGTSSPDVILTGGAFSPEPDSDAVLVNLVTYREQ
jgi:predicted anti-sigma-YlaC factor YlaD